MIKFDIFGKRIIEVERSNNEWLAFYRGNNGVKRKAEGISIPASIKESELETYLADIFHEWATIERNEVKRL